MPVSLPAKYLVFILLLPGFTAHAASKSDLAKEKRWEEQIVPSLMVGDAMTLTADDVEFLALYAEATTEQAKGAVILMHGMGVHPAWPDVIDPLRMELPEHGWHTLSLQMPILANEAEYNDYATLFPEVPVRIQAAVDYLKQEGVSTIVLAGHSLGATMGTHYLATAGDPAVKLFAILSDGPGLAGDARMDSLANFRKITDVFVLDVYGSEDEDYVLKAVQERKGLAADSLGDRYQQLKIEGAGHFYQNRQEDLLSGLSSKLDEILAP